MPGSARTGWRMVIRAMDKKTTLRVGWRCESARVSPVGRAPRQNLLSPLLVGRSSSSSGTGGNTAKRKKNSQEAHGKDADEHQLLPPAHLQRPHDGDGQQEDDDIG